MIFFLYINICKDTYIYVHHIHAIKKEGKEQQVGWPEAVKTPDRLSVGLTNQHLLV
jgi:hypothetical protein